MTFGERLKLARERKGLKRHELGFSRSYIHYVENNQRSMLAQHIVKVCLVLHITPNWLLLGRERL
jgi:transcriptional regulator with XRE-family HTH domain